MTREEEAEDDAIEAADKALDAEADPRGMAIAEILLDRLSDWSADDFVALPNSIVEEGTAFDLAEFGVKSMDAMVFPSDRCVHDVQCEVQAAARGLRWKVRVRRGTGPFFPWPARYPPDDDHAVAEAILTAMHHVCGRREPDRERPPRDRRPWRAPEPFRRGAGDARNYRVKVTLRDTDPPVWRRLVVPARMDLGTFHRALQGAMGWEEAHTHLFEAEGRRYSDPAFGFGDDGDEVLDEQRTDLETATRGGTIPLDYVYDFGDRWEHLVEVDGTAPEDGIPPELPACTEGGRHCPPEDVGGPAGYRRFLASLVRSWVARPAPSAPWAEPGIDPDSFDPVAADWWMRMGLR